MDERRMAGKGSEGSVRTKAGKGFQNPSGAACAA